MFSDTVISFGSKMVDSCVFCRPEITIFPSNIQAKFSKNEQRIVHKKLNTFIWAITRLNMYFHNQLTIYDYLNTTLSPLYDEY